MKEASYSKAPVVGAHKRPKQTVSVIDDHVTPNQASPSVTPQMNRDPHEGAAASGGMAPTESHSNNVPQPDNFNPPVKGQGRALYPKQGV